jgi:hypothetical protein
MNFKKTKTTTIVVLVLLLTFSAIAACLPETVNALTTAQTWAYISVIPNPIGVAQTTHIRIFLQPFPPTASNFFHGFTWKIIKPDGTIENGGPVTSDGNGAYDFEYAPIAVGNYTVQFNYPGETFTNVNQTDLPASASATFTAQQQQITAFPGTPLPKGYWTRPISDEFREWNTISGNWLVQGYDASGRMYADASGFNPYTQAPRAPHIMWTMPLTNGGLVGGQYQSDSYYTGVQYTSLATPPLVIEGRIYYRLFMSTSGEKGRVPGFACADLRTGQEYWRNTTGNIDFAQIFDSQGFNGQGGVAMLYDASTSTWVIYDAFSGTPLYYLTGALTNPDKVFYGPMGDVFAVFHGGNSSQPWIVMWNSTKAFEAYSFLSGGSYEGPQRTGSYNWTLGIQYNVTTPSTAPFVISQSGHNMPADASTNTILLIATPPAAPNNGSAYETGFNILTGQVLWGPIRRDFDGTYTNRIATGEGVYVQLNAATLQHIGISMTTGQQLWESGPNAAPWGQYTGMGAVAYGMAYQGAYDGYERAINLTTGKEVWSFYAGNSGLETPLGSWPMFNGPIVGYYVVFCGYSEHTPNAPLYRGAQVFALDATTGAELWSLHGYLSLRALVDGYLIAVNGYDNQMYVIGKGPSATTVSAPQTTVQKGSSVMITGTVTDQSVGAKGTPAISDASMGAWMEYTYMQKPMPTNATGVLVTLTAIGPDGNTVNIGTTISDIGGNYGIMWTPPTEGKYQIIANFAGSDSYGSSYGTAYLGVSSAPSAAPIITATPIQNPVPTSSPAQTTSTPSPVIAPTGQTPTVTYIVIAAVVVIIVVAAAALALRRRK